MDSDSFTFTKSPVAGRATGTGREGTVLTSAGAFFGAAECTPDDALTAYPNPAAGRATLQYALAEAGAVRLAVYDVLGREVAVPVDRAQEAGAHAVVCGVSALEPGVDVLRLETGRLVETHRLVVAR
jgi:hypothetical protein